MYAGPLATFLILILIGIAAAFLFDRYVGTSWFTRQVSSSQRRLITGSLVGIAGSFMGYHLFALLGIVIAGSLGLYIGAIVGAAAVLYFWRRMR
jgi:uncharacterized membrane protein YeaQ/YmgE (transglycosylase-associated protein family)